MLTHDAFAGNLIMLHFDEVGVSGKARGASSSSVVLTATFTGGCVVLLVDTEADFLHTCRAQHHNTIDNSLDNACTVDDTITNDNVVASNSDDNANDLDSN